MVLRRGLIYFFLSLALFFRLLLATFNSPKVSNLHNKFDFLQTKLDLTFASFLPNTEAGLLSGIVLGNKKSLPPKLYDQMQQTGTLHIAVASGMNIALMAQPALVFLTLFLKRKIALIPLLFLIWFYAFLTGFQPPIIRASIMASLLYLAQEFGRKADNIRILWLTGYVMVLINPQLVFDLSLQLSFSSMLGLVFIQPILKNSQNRLLRLESFSSTLACQIATLPLIMINFGKYNLISPLVNLLVLWTTPHILQFGLFAAIFSFIINQIAKLLMCLIYPLLKYFVIVVEVFSGLKIFQVWTPKWGIAAGISYYLILIYWLWRKKKAQEIIKRHDLKF